MKEVGGTSANSAKEFEDLRVYRQARTLVARVYAHTTHPSFSRDYALRDQIRRAAISILSNIAEGFERRTDAAFAHSLLIAKGSCGEVRAQATIAFDQKYISKKDYIELQSECRHLSSGLAKLIVYLKRSRSRKQKTG